MELSALSLRLRALSVLRGLLSHPLVRAYGDTLTALDGTAADFADRYGALCATRFSCGDIAQADRYHQRTGSGCAQRRNPRSGRAERSARARR